MSQMILKASHLCNFMCGMFLSRVPQRSALAPPGTTESLGVKKEKKKEACATQ